MEIKVICIKYTSESDSLCGLFIKHDIYNILNITDKYYELAHIEDKHGVGIEKEVFEEYFILFSEFREQRIDNILND